MSGMDGKQLVEHLQEQIMHYFQNAGAKVASVKFINELARPASVFYRFEVVITHKQRYILIKVPLRRDQAIPGEALPDRPRLYPVTDSEHKYQLEYRALAKIQDYIEQLDDPRFGAVRVLGFLPEHRALMMEELQDPRLDHLFLKTNRLQSLFDDVDLSRQFYNAGAWLRAYHALPGQDQAKILHPSRADFITLLRKLADYLANMLDDRPFFHQVFSVAATSAYKELPEKLPLGLGHRDYTMRNILVGPHGRVTGLDTLAKWRTPIYEDIAYFLVGLKMNRLQVLSMGATFSSECLDWYEQRFLTGYFGQGPIPYSRIRLYELLIALNKWSSWVSQADGHTKGGLQHIWAQFQLLLVNRFFRQSVGKLLQIHEINRFDVQSRQSKASRT